MNDKNDPAKREKNYPDDPAKPGPAAIWETSTSSDIFPLDDCEAGLQRAEARIPTGPGFRRKRNAWPAKPVERRENERPSFGAQQRLPTKSPPSWSSGSAGGNQDTPAACKSLQGQTKRQQQPAPDDWPRCREGRGDVRCP